MVMPVGVPLRFAVLDGRYCWPVAEVVARLHYDENTVALVERLRGDAGDEPVVPEAAVAHEIEIGRLPMFGPTAAALASDMP